MPTTRVYKDVKILSGGYDISGAANQLDLRAAYDKVPVRHFGQDCHYATKGLLRVTFSLQGHAYSNDDPAGVEDVLHGRFGVADVPMSWCPVTGAAGEVGYFCKTLETVYQAGGQAGQMYDYTAEGEGENVMLVRGTIMENGAKSSSGSGTARNLGAASATQKLYACMHIVAASGTDPTLDVVVESDDAEGFTDPVTRATFAQASAIGSQFLTPVAGPITDTWWRAKWTLGGTDPAFTIAVLVGIQ